MPTNDAGGPAKIALETARAVAEVYLRGGHIAAWRVHGREQLFLSTASEYRAGVAIRGGVPVIFPQFAGLGDLPKHGFARTATWHLIDGATTRESACLRLGLQDSPASRALWPFPFALELGITIAGETLEVGLTVTNTGTAAFSFTAALHTYLKVVDLDALRIAGLGGLPYIDSAQSGIRGVQVDELLAIVGEVDRIYAGVTGPLTILDTERTLRVFASGFQDVVIWNPGTTKALALVDLEPGGEQAMVCVEAAAIAVPITLAPSARWRGIQRIEVDYNTSI